MTETPDDLRSLARSLTRAALDTLEAVMQADDATPAVRVSAANAILERGWGKPTQPAEAAGNDQRALSELSTAELIARVAAILAQPAEGDRGQGTGEAESVDLRQRDRDPGSAGSS
ncbi:hypothetical protein [Bradyrhizobium sp. LHD-71]|uniref:hypothetical protein n=1 Tax=Bradyrhizobium sp. LHD-71 TaxID=3072141 RepID=UPI00280EB3C0|nr:hypothetical protein [Bradyrhizobium sp. LHD-71]MDQ8730550.1 hypothetical protein [Bradyrhizobium sp. LHD-71]